jgi:hypothetical protein
MKSKLLLACLIGLSVGISTIPAQAFGIAFNAYDHNHDRRWDRREYYNACNDWHCHNDRHYYRRAVYPGYDRWDRNHDGYLNEREVRAIRTW